MVELYFSSWYNANDEMKRSYYYAGGADTGNMWIRRENDMDLNQERVAQLQLPDPADADPHPRLLLAGRGIHAGECFTAMFPDGWHDITLEVSWELTGPGCWYISTPGFDDICPVGLFVKI